MDSVSKKLLQKISGAYKLPDLILVRKVEEGYLSHNFIVKTNRKHYFLKMHRYRDKNRLEEVFKVEDYFASHGIPVLSPILTKDDQKGIWDNGSLFSLYPFVQGKMLTRRTIRKPAIKLAAQMLAKIHLLSKSRLPKLTSKINNGWKENVFKQRYSILKEIISKKKSQFDKRSLEILELKMSLCKENKISRKQLKLGKPHLNHDDYHLRNLFFENNKVKWIIDWEKTAVDTRYHELLRAMDLICFGKIHNKTRWEKAEIFLREYHKLYPIKPRVFHNELLDYYLSRVHSTWLLWEYYQSDNKRIKPLMSQELVKIKFYRDNLNNLNEMCKRVVK